MAAERRAAARAPDRFEQPGPGLLRAVREGYAQRMAQAPRALRAPGRLARPRARCGRRSNRRWSSGHGGRRRRPRCRCRGWQAPLRQALQQQRAHALLVQAAPASARCEFMLTLAQAWLCEGPAEPRGPAAVAAVATWCSRARTRTCTCCCPRPCACRWAGPSGRRRRRQRARQEEAQPADQDRRGARRHRLGGAELVARPRQGAAAAPGRGHEPAGRQRAAEDAGRATRPGAAAAEHRATRRGCCPRCAAAASAFAWPRPTADAGRAWLAEQGVADAPVLLAAAGGAPLAALATGGGGHRRRRLAGAAARGRRTGRPRRWPAGRCRARWTRCRSSATTRWCAPPAAQPRYFAPQALPAGADLGRCCAWARSLGRVARHDEHPWNDGAAGRSAGRRRPRMLARSHDSRPPQRAGPWIHSAR